MYGVSVHLIEPGWFDTKIAASGRLKAMYQRLYDRSPEEIQREYGAFYVEEGKGRLVVSKLFYA